MMAQFVNSGTVALLLLASLAVLANATAKPSDWQLCGKPFELCVCNLSLCNLSLYK